jgi:hypothetical protein
LFGDVAGVTAAFSADSDTGRTQSLKSRLLGLEYRRGASPVANTDGTGGGTSTKETTAIGTFVHK